MLNRFLCLVIIAFILGCDRAGEVSVPTNDDTNSIPATLGNAFQLKIDQIAFIKSENIRIKFLKVTEDSRCPSDVVCIWAGQVGVLINVSKNGQDLGDLTLISGAGNKELATKSFDGYSANLMKVEPYPISTERIEPSDYVITLVVTK